MVRVRMRSSISSCHHKRNSLKPLLFTSTAACGSFSGLCEQRDPLTLSPSTPLSAHSLALHPCFSRLTG